MDFAVLTDHRAKMKESEKVDKYLDLARELKKLWNMRVTVIPIVDSALGTVLKGLKKGLENQRKNRDNPYQSFVKIGQNIEKSPGDLKKLAVTQTPVKKL